MSAVLSLQELVSGGQVWRGQSIVRPQATQASGHAELDAVLPGGGWPESSLSEILFDRDGLGELRLLLPTLARLSAQGQVIGVIAPPYQIYARAWAAAGVDFRQLQLIEADPADALWATEQCLRSGCMAAVLCWPGRADGKVLRRLQLAAQAGQCLGFAFRDSAYAEQPSAAALRLLLKRGGQHLQVLKCKGGLAPANDLPSPVRCH